MKTLRESRRLGSANKFLRSEKESKRSIAYVFLPEKEPHCNFGKCDDCFVLASDSYRDRVHRTEEEIVSDLEELVQEHIVFASTTEILQFRNRIRILEITKADYVLSNGLIISQKPSVLSGLNEIGVKDVIFTGNLDDAGYDLPPRDYTVRAIQEVLNSELNPGIRISITKNNIHNLEDNIRYYYEQGVQSFRIGRLIPISNYKRDSEILDGKYAIELLKEIEKVKKIFPFDNRTKKGVYIHLVAILGTQYRDPKHHFRCGAGENFFAIGPDNYIYPCVFLQQKENRIGKWENQKLCIEKSWSVEGNPLDCPAFNYFLQKRKAEEQ